jgi:hypothetical protein
LMTPCAVATTRLPLWLTPPAPPPTTTSSHGLLFLFFIGHVSNHVCNFVCNVFPSSMQCKFSFYYKGLNDRTHYPSTHLHLAAYGTADGGGGGNKTPLHF